jgi:endonuclease/exonuclease/phosphatase family metal-dependent hydrolase
LPILVRSWNVFHGNTLPPSRLGHLRNMVELASGDSPDVLCLQEVPVWALTELGRWSGMRSIGMVARPGWRPARLAAWVTRRNQGLFRSKLAGQANVILVANRHRTVALGSRQVSDPGRERRVVHAVRLDGVGVVATTHLTNSPSTPEVQRAELARIDTFLNRVAEPDETRIIAGDLNLKRPTLPGYVDGGDGIDHVLVAGAPAGPLLVWPRERRMQNGHVLSDHAPVERLVG